MAATTCTRQPTGQLGDGLDVERPALGTMLTSPTITLKAAGMHCRT